MEQGFERQSACRPHQLLGHRFQAFHQEWCRFEPTKRRLIFKVRGYGTGHRGEHRIIPQSL